MTERYRVLKHDDDTSSGCDFASDVDAGLSRPQKSISSKYLYDAEGDLLFQRIMDLPEYYLTRCEYEILRNNRDTISALLGKEQLNIVELGAGDGKKTFLLLEHFLEKGLEFKYVPIDISESAIRGLIASCCECYDQIAVEGLVAEYFDGLRWLASQNQRRNFVLFLGSNIGNFTRNEAELFLGGLWDALNDGDLVLIGFDLKKDIDRVRDAYNDSQGVTAQFNINLLHRINRELGANFDVDQFEHYCAYNDDLDAIESYLVSSRKQDVHIDGLDRTFCFEEKEPIHVEYSHKFSEEDIAQLAVCTGFKIVAQYYDSDHLFVDSLWRAIK